MVKDGDDNSAITETSDQTSSTKTECDYLDGWIKKKKNHIRKHLIQNGEPQRYSWGTQEKKKFRLAISPGHGDLTPGQPVLALTL